MDGITNTMDVNLGKLQEMMRNREAWRAAVHWVTKSRTRLNNNNNTSQGNKIQKAGGWHSALGRAADAVARIPGFWTCVFNLPTRWCCPFEALVLACVVREPD